MPASTRPFVITVLAGVNGAGKSSVAGALLEQNGTPFYNPDVVARTARQLSPTLTAEGANDFAWHKGKVLLEAAIANRTDFNFETTLGGNTLTQLLIEAAKQGATLNIWYAGLVTVQLHIQRVAARVGKGGHAIPEANIRKRWVGSHLNLVKLLPHVTNLRVYDNSAERDPGAGKTPEPTLVLSVTKGAIDLPGPEAVQDTPEWAKPIVVAAFKALSGA